MRLFTFLIIVLQLTTTPSFCQKRESKLYNIENGLNANGVNDIVRDNEGNFWIGTDVGLKKFDGINFIDIKIKNQTFNKKSIRKLALFKNVLYLIYHENGCIALNLNDFKSKLITNEKLDDIFIHNSTSYLLLSLNTIKIISKNKTELKKIPVLNNKANTKINVGSISYNNHLYVSIPNTGIYIYKNNIFKKISTHETYPGGYKERFEIFKNQLYYIGLNYPYSFNESICKKIDVKKNNNRTVVNDIQFVSNNEYYYILGNKKLIHYKNGKTNEIEYFIDNNIELRKIIIANTNLIYVATNKGLLEITIPNLFIKNLINDFPIKSDLFRVRRKIIVEDDKILLFGNPNVIKYQNKKFTTITGPTTSIYDAVKTKDGFYVATEGKGLLHYENNLKKFKKIKLTAEENFDYNIYCALYYDNDTDILYVGGYEYVCYFKNGTNKQYYIKNPFPNNMTKVIVKDRVNKRLLIGTDNGVYVVDCKTHKIIKNLNREKLLTGSIIGDICIDYKRKLIWIGHDKGIDVLDLTTFTRIRHISLNFFSNPKVASLQMDNNNKIWASTFSGIAGYDFEKNVFIRLQKNNGLINEEFNFKSGAKLTNGNLIFGGLNGYDIINPKKIPFNLIKRNGIISGIHLFTNKDTIFSNFEKNKEISYDESNYFSRVYLSTKKNISPSKSNFEYKINNGPWINLKGRGYFDLVGLSHNYYTIKIRGFDEYGRLITFDDLKIIITQKFYKSANFSILIFILVIFLVTYVAILNIKKNKAKNAIYEQISMDLHDEIGTILSRTTLLTKSQNEINSETRKQIIEYLNEANFGLRIYINTINAGKKPIIELYDETNEVYQKSLSIKNIIFTAVFKGNEKQEILSGLYRDIKLCLFEISNNIIKHSNATEVELSISEKNKRLYISVTENGTNFDFDNSSGNGLGNIKKRTKRNNGDVFVEKTSSELKITLYFKIY